ncbi:membrane-associated guanylate kinase, partial [Triplophysa rosa]
GLYILRLAEDGPALKDGRIHVGDQVVEINGEQTQGISHTRAIELIQAGGNIVHLLLQPQALLSENSSSEKVPLSDPRGSNASNIPLRSPLHHPSSPPVKKRTSDLSNSIASSPASLDLVLQDPHPKDSNKEKRTKPQKPSASSSSRQRRLKSWSTENLIDVEDTKKPKTPSKAKDRAHNHKENPQRGTNKHALSNRLSRSVSPQKSEVVVERGREKERRARPIPGVDQRKSDTQKRRKPETTKENETQERKERGRAERKVKSEEEVDLKRAQRKKKDGRQLHDGHISNREEEKKSKQAKEKRSSKEDSRNEVTDRKRDTKENESNNEDTNSTNDAAPVTNRSSLVFDSPVTNGLWKIPSYARILTREEVMRDVFD